MPPKAKDMTKDEESNLSNMRHQPRQTSPVPRLGMLVDRSSFDETESFGIDHEAIKSSFDTQKLNTSQSTVLKNGKVRRRLRWRPKRFKNGSDRLELDASGGGTSTPKKPHGRRKKSSNVSVESVGGSSRASQKSMHSFASTQTVKKTNKKPTARTNRLSLMRPNYSSTFDGCSKNTNCLATISDGANLDLAREASMTNQGSENGADETNRSDENIQNQEFQRKEAKSSEQVPPKPPTMPPLSNRSNSRPNNKASGSLRSNDNDSDGSHKPPPPRGTKGSSTPVDVDEILNQESILFSRSSSQNEPQELIPSLSTNELLSSRRVDLRIPGIPSATSSMTGKSLKNIDELSINTDDEHTDTEDEGHDEPSNPSSTKALQNKSDGEVTSTTNMLKHTRSSASADPKELRFSMAQMQNMTRSRSSELPSKAKWEIPEETEIAAKVEDADKSTADSSPASSFMHEGTVIPSTPSSQQSVPSSLKPPTSVPVDVDDGSFLDAEKNLQAIHEIGIEHIRHGEYTEALEVFEEILRGQLTRYGRDHRRVGTALHNIGLVRMKQGNFIEAARVCREAVRVRQVALGNDHPDLAVSLAQLGVAYLEMGKNKRAIVNFRQALRIRRQAFGSKHPKVAKLLNNIGCALYELNELEVAKVAFEEALDIQRDTLRMNHEETDDQEDSTPNQILLSISSTLCNIGSIKLYWGQFEDASIDLEEALLIQQSVLGDDHPLSERTAESLDWIDQAQDNYIFDENLEENQEDCVKINPILRNSHKNQYIPSTHDRLRDLGLVCSNSDNDESEGDNRNPLTIALSAMEKKLLLLKAGIEITCSPSRGENLANTTWEGPCALSGRGFHHEEKKSSFEADEIQYLRDGQAMI